ncbi:MAG TPA: MYXO-CTERM sorting domain-containing protein [Polyangiaceae bacterium]|nr:MYXO-CTERM sorting domain-containing protein [Polyangiaceae bacterium]
MRWATVLAFFAALAVPAVARAATINVTPSDSYAKIEAAQAGDEVVLAPGKYAFRLHLTGQGTANAPIVIRAQDPSNPPVFDLSGTLVENAPGSYTAGDRGRGCWQFDGASHYTVESVVFTGCHTASFNSAGIRYYNGSTGIYLKDCVFHDNDDGLTGGTQDSDITVEFSEFYANGNLQASSSSPTHNLYIYGGTFTLRYSYVHDPVQAQNFHVRAKQSTLEYNWFARGKSYEGDLMTDDDFTGGGAFSQTMLFRGNVIVEGTPANHSQIIAVYNDSALASDTFSIDVESNTVVAAAPQGALVHLSNADGTTMSATLNDNILTVSTTAYAVEDAVHGTVTGGHNWLQAGTSAGSLTSSVFGTDPKFLTTPAYRLDPSSACVGAAASNANSPDKEYYLDETTTRGYRLRASVHDIGAFESTTTGPGIGPYDSPPPPGDGGAPNSDGGMMPFDEAGAPGGDGGTVQGGAGGCGCAVPAGPSPLGPSMAGLGLLLALLRRRRRTPC